MSRESNEFGPTLLIGPGLDEPRPERSVQADPPQIQGRKLLLRLVIAFFLVMAIAIACLVLLPMVGIPPWVPLAAFAAIAVAVLVNAKTEGQLPGPSAQDPEDCGCGDGRPIGCCPGPRPPSFLRDGPRRR